MREKISWSGQLIDSWASPMDYCSAFYIPKRWWSWKAWRLAFQFRGYVNERVFALLASSVAWMNTEKSPDNRLRRCWCEASRHPKKEGEGEVY